MHFAGAPCRSIFHGRGTGQLSVTVRWLICEYTAIARKRSKSELSLLPSVSVFVAMHEHESYSVIPKP